MMDTRTSRTLAIFFLFFVLTICAATGLPGTRFAEPMPRGMRALDWTVTTFGTAPFGSVGGALLFAVVGVFLTFLSYRQKPTERSSGMGDVRDQNQDRPDTDQPTTGRASFGRKRGPQAPPLEGPRQPAMTRWEIEALFDTDGDTTPKPGWSLVLRSPYDTWEGATSWLGGRPTAPRDFAWPADEDGSPLTFLAQIDLASIDPEPSTGQRPAGLPVSGSIVIFVGRTYSCHMLTEAEMKEATPLSLPADLPTVEKHGFFGEGQTLVHWPVSPVAFFDTGQEGRPDCFPGRFANIVTWINNWGIAAFEAEVALECLTTELRFAGSFYETQDSLLRDGGPLPTGEAYTLNAHYSAQILAAAPDMVSALREWHQQALARPAEEPVGDLSLAAIFEKRLAFVDRLTGNYRPKSVLPGNPKEVWQKLTLKYGGADPQLFFQSLPSVYRPFVEACVTDWRGHRLFGVEPPFPNNPEDLRAHSCLISIAADPLLETCSEHEYGMSVWCPNEDMSRGRFDQGQFVRHCAV